MVILTMFMVLLLLLSINVPIAIGLAVTTIIAMVMKTGTSFLIDTAIVMFDGSMKFPLIAIPLFILAGSIMNSAGISRRLIAFASALVGFIKGGLSMINIATSMFFAEISGSAVADVAALGSILIPAMKKKGYPGPFAAAVTSSVAAGSSVDNDRGRKRKDRSARETECSGSDQKEVEDEGDSDEDGGRRSQNPFASFFSRL